MLTWLGFHSFRLLLNLGCRASNPHITSKVPWHIFSTNGPNKYIQQKGTTNTHNKCCTVWNSQGSRLMSLFSTIVSLRKTSLRRDTIVETRTLILSLGCCTQDKTTNRHNKYTQHVHTTNRHNNYTQQRPSSKH